MFYLSIEINIILVYVCRDHAGGNEEFVSLSNGNIEVYGGDDRIGALTNKVGQNDEISFASYTIRVLFTPCHTTGHVLYYLDDGLKKYLFCGDTLFVGGCGRFFEGNAKQMVDALCVQVKSLPEDTLVMCGHEYTVSNLKFASTVDPDNNILQNKLEWAIQQREKNEYTVPSTLKEELSFNPFMRVDVPAIKNAVNLPDGSLEEVMHALRKKKNNA